jgi:hypothetical protein
MLERPTPGYFGERRADAPVAVLSVDLACPTVAARSSGHGMRSLCKVEQSQQPVCWLPDNGDDAKSQDAATTTYL